MLQKLLQKYTLDVGPCPVPLPCAAELSLKNGPRVRAFTPKAMGDNGLDGGRDQQCRILADGAQVQWDRKAPANFQAHANATTIHPPISPENWSAIQASRYGAGPSGARRNAPPKLRGRGWGMDPDACLSPFGQSPLVYNGVGMSPTKVSGVWARGGLSPRSLNVSNERGLRLTTSVSEPLLLPDGRTRDGNLIERHATDIHEGKPWRKDIPWAPKEDHDADAAKDARNRSDQGTKAENSSRNSVQRHATDIHEGRPWRRSIPLAPSEYYGQSDPHPQPPHMRSEVHSVIYGRLDIYGRQREDAQDVHGVPTSFMKPPEQRTGGMAALSNPYSGGASRASYARGWNPNLLSAESNAKQAAVEAVRRAATVLCLHPLALTSDSPSPPLPPPLPERPPPPTTLLPPPCAVLHAPLRLTSTSTSPPAGSTSCTSTSTFYHPPTPCPWQVRTLPDANMLWRHQLVESDIRQHYRNPEMPSSPPIK